jgi:P27 family predicted phage terminase small subunit
MGKRGPKTRNPISIPLTQDWSIPSHLKRVARAEFLHTVDLLRQRGTIAKTDVTLVVRRAELCEIALKAYNESRSEPFTTSDRDNLSPHPGLKVHHSASLAIKAIDVELGLTPASSSTPAARQAAASGGYSHWQQYLGSKRS